MLGYMITIMLGGFALSVPVAVALGFAGLLGLLLFTNLPPLIFAQQLYVALDKFALVAVPLFILAGNLMQAGGISKRFVDVAQAMVGSLRGGMGATCVVTCMIFAAVSGSGVATTFAVGSIMIPALARTGYPRPFAAATQAASSELGVIIPPSIPLILYAVSAQVSIGDLFIAGIGPGIFIAIALISTIMVWSYINRDKLNNDVDRISLGRALWRAIPSLLTPVIILGGIYGGVFTPTEAAAVAVFYALFVGIVVHRELKSSQITSVLRGSLRNAASIMLIISAAGVFSYLISRAGIPAALGVWLTDHMESRVMFLLGVNIALFIIGMFLETSASIIILTPILVPVAMHFGIDPVHFGIMMVVNLALGLITPPFGVNLFAACQVAGISVQSIIRPIYLYVFIIIACLMIITYFPPLSLFLIR